MKHYFFVTTFTIDAKIERCWDLVKAYPKWSTWWSMIHTLSVLGNGTTDSISFKVGFFPYYLQLKFIPVDQHLYDFMFFKSTGDLVGTGMFEFVPIGDMTRISFEWKVQTVKPWMNRWEPILRPFFVLSHTLVMRSFVRGIGKELKARVSDIRYEGK